MVYSEVEGCFELRNMMSHKPLRPKLISNESLSSNLVLKYCF